MHYIAIWRYEVRPERVDEFLGAYGPDGVWCRLFRRVDGYVTTYLLRDASSGTGFVTVDIWTSEAAYRTFRARFSSEYEVADLRCAELTVREEKVAEGEAGGPR